MNLPKHYHWLTRNTRKKQEMKKNNISPLKYDSLLKNFDILEHWIQLWHKDFITSVKNDIMQQHYEIIITSMKLFYQKKLSLRRYTFFGLSKKIFERSCHLLFLLCKEVLNIFYFQITSKWFEWNEILIKRKICLTQLTYQLPW